MDRAQATPGTHLWAAGGAFQRCSNSTALHFPKALSSYDAAPSDTLSAGACENVRDWLYVDDHAKPSTDRHTADDPATSINQRPCGTRPGSHQDHLQPALTKRPRAGGASLGPDHNRRPDWAT